MNGSGDVDANLEFTSMSNDPQFMVSIYLKGLFYNVSIGDPAHGYLVHKKTSSFRVAVGWLQDQARRLYRTRDTCKNYSRPINFSLLSSNYFGRAVAPGVHPDATARVLETRLVTRRNRLLQAAMNSAASFGALTFLPITISRAVILRP